MIEYATAIVCGVIIALISDDVSQLLAGTAAICIAFLTGLLLLV